MNPYAPLLGAGIGPATLGRFGVRPAPYSWAYPVHDPEGRLLGYRHKRRRGEGAKYWPDRRAPAPADALYNARAVRPDKPVILAAGEKDTWLLDTLCLPACSFLCGEGSVPAPAVGVLAALGPSRVLVVYDRDETGAAGAQRAVRAIGEAGLAAVALALPESLPVGGDVCDLFAACGQDRARFVAALASLPPLPIPERPCAPMWRVREPGDASPANPTVSAFERFKREHPIAEVVSAVIPLQPKGHRLVGLCPWHDDHHPSFEVDTARGRFHCSPCGVHGDVIDFLRRWRGQGATL